MELLFGRCPLYQRFPTLFCHATHAGPVFLSRCTNSFRAACFEYRMAMIPNHNNLLKEIQSIGLKMLDFVFLAKEGVH